MELAERWEKLCSRWTVVDSKSRALYTCLKALYAPRPYHTIPFHIKTMLSYFDEYLHMVEQPGLMEFAIWLHDAVDDLNRGSLDVGNEQHSAEIAKAFLLSLGAHHTSINRVQQLILATEYDHEHKTGDELLMADLDMLILASEEHVYDWYAAGVREEYVRLLGYKDLQYTSGRIAFLNKLSKRTIFHSAEIGGRFEEKAHANIQRELCSIDGE